MSNKDKCLHTRSTTLCKIPDAGCASNMQTPWDITSGCSKLAGTEYTKRHNIVASIVYRAICAEYDLEDSKDWWVKPEKVVRNDHAKIL